MSKKHNDHVKKFFNMSYYFWLFGLLFFELVLFLITYFVSKSVSDSYLKITSATFLIVGSLLLLPHLYYWLNQKVFNSKRFSENNRNIKFKIKKSDERLIDRFYLNVEYNKHNLRYAQIRSWLWYIAVSLIPVIVAFIIGFTLSFV
ncbi:hypothetical protein EI74_0774 [Mycoplasma testudineum]|uniref:Uncharacterized protein n=1 Tax=Mycoplasma testudineum TaxID=244584 RepID=A0A4R6IDZ0_9MOLU|nr:hypothetical protein [Mycoplasma testudineum]TDO19125.1 hypothetical protein EI74_0774 [Mycoplasma testudineum]